MNAQTRWPGFGYVQVPGLAKWIRAEGVLLAREVESVCVPFGCHVALTGGVLYKDGPRKDCDLIFYRIRQVEKIDMVGLWGALAQIGLERIGGNGWCHKARYEGKNVDCLFPEGKWLDENGNEINYGTVEPMDEFVAALNGDLV